MNMVICILSGVGIGIMVELLLPGHTPSELVLAMTLGTAGALLARYIGQMADWYGADEPGSFVGSALGTIVFLVFYGLLFRRGHRRRPPLGH